MASRGKFLCKDCRDRIAKRRNVCVDSLPNALCFNLKIGVRGEFPIGDNILPRNFRMPVLEFIRQACRGFSKNNEVQLCGTSHDIACNERRLIKALHNGQDFVATAEYVLEQELIRSHKSIVPWAVWRHASGGACSLWKPSQPCGEQVRKVSPPVRNSHRDRVLNPDETPP